MNKVIITGNITKDLELKHTQDSKSYLRFTIASRRDKDTADFISCVAWNKTAELIAQYHKKGDPIGIIGAIRTGSYDSPNGKVYTTDVYVNEIEFMKKNESKQHSAQEKKEMYQEMHAEQNFLDAPRIEYPQHNEVPIDSDNLPFY